MKYLFFTCFLLPIIGKSQIVASGSFSVAALCKDGIIIAADTRAAFWKGEMDKLPDFKGEPFVYYDTTQKIFPMKNFIFCCIGLQTFGDKFVTYYIKEYEKTLSDSATVSDAKEGFLRFINKKYPEHLKAFLTTKITIIGYENNKPQICIVQHQRWECSIDGYAVSDTLAGFIKVYSPKYTCKKMAKIIEKTITSYVEKYNKSDVVGGPIMIVKIMPDNTIKWLKNKPTRTNWLSMQELSKDYRAKKVKMNFKTKEDELLFENSVKYYLSEN